ncbi:chromosomal replication initiator protein DnaA [Propionimicrobium lymphophilum]|uniref:chromosomal replication initiator protein DnaA n=1 Tax=Propionimicrobium lymphophilum TaxID=33012 RepID=UPI003C6E8AA0
MSELGSELGAFPDRVETPSAQDAWQKVLDAADAAARAWLRSSKPLTVHESTLMVAVPNEFTRERIESRQRVQIEEVLSDLFHKPMRLAITIEPDLELALEPPVRDEEDEEPVEVAKFVPKQNVPELIASDTQTADDGDRLNPKYTFDNFVIGSSNRFAHAAAVAVAEAPGKAYNPLMIYGQSGLGKTHLLHALGHYVRNYYQDVRVKYVSTEEMTNHFINAISENRTNEFRRSYREVDVLLIDDIQFLESKIQTQEEFFHTFNTLHNAQKQIVMTSDRPPKALEALETRLRSRFEWGLITDIQPPDLETRMAILQRKAISERLKVPVDALEFIASNITTNIRELEGALIRVTAFASLNGQAVDLKLTEDVLQDLIPAGSEREVNAQTIIEETANYFGITPEEVCSTSRTQTLVRARQVSMYLCRELTELSLPKIGTEFGGKDHTTVMHAVKKIRQLMAERRSVYNQVTELTNLIKNGG